MAGGRAVVVFVLAFMLTGTLILHLDTKVKAYVPEIIVPDQYSTIQEAIDHANDGDTVFVRSGTYYEHVDVKKTIAFIGEDRDAVIIDGGGTGVIVNITADGVNMTGFTVRRSGTGGYIGDDPPMNPPIYPKTAGIYLQNVTNCRLFENNVVETYVGIQLEHGANRNFIANNTLRNNTWAGIGTHEACWNSFLSNNITDNLDSVMIRVDSNNNTFSENIITASNWGVTIDRCSNNTISGNHIRSSNIGVNLQKSDSNNIFDNDFRDNYCGIQVFTSQHNRISENELTRNYCAVEITHYSSDNQVFGNNVTENSYGVGFWYSDGNIVYENNISHNGLYGILVSYSRDNRFYHDNFVGNTQQMSISSGYINRLDDGHPSGGNYWSDYNGTDFYQGLGQNETGSDGIGDSPYVIGSNNRDSYPLMKASPWGEHDVGIMYIGRVYSFDIVVPLKTVVGLRFSLNISTFVMNYGNQTETFNLQVYANDTLVGAFANVTLASRQSVILSLRWSTTGFAYVNYTVRAVADNVLGETDISDNVHTDGIVYVGIPGDVNGDGRVNLKDIAYVAIRFDKNPNDPNWSPNADLNDDEKIDMFDIDNAVKEFGEHL